MPHPLTEKLIQRQINHWNRYRQYLTEPDHDSPGPTGPIITISRLAGSGGRLLARALASRLDLQLHDQSLVEKITRDKQLEESMIAELDESEMNQARLWVRGVLNQRIFMRDQYHLALVKVVTALASKGSAVFLGRGANLILRDAATMRLRLVAGYQVRLTNIMERTGLTRPEARALLEETDRRRAEYIRKVFREEPGKPGNYDLVINTDRLDLDSQIELVLLALLQMGQETRSALGSQAAKG